MKKEVDEYHQTSRKVHQEVIRNLFMENQKVEEKFQKMIGISQNETKKKFASNC